MVKQAKSIESIYELFIDDKIIELIQLIRLGFNDRDILELVEKGILKKVHIGFYTYGNIDSLINYAVSLNNKGDFVKTKQCLEKYWESFRESFLEKIDNKKFADVFQYIDLFITYGKSVDANIYLYLLGYITKIPEKYQKQLMRIEYKDVTEQRPCGRKIKRKNSIRNKIIDANFVEAYRMLDAYYSNSNNLDIRILKRLVFAAGENEITDIIESEGNKIQANYFLITKVLSKLDEKYQLNLSTANVLTLITDYFKIKGNITLENIDLTSVLDILTALDNNDFEGALQLCKNLLESEKYVDATSYKMLSYIITLVNELNAVNSYKPIAISNFDIEEYIKEKIIESNKNEGPIILKSMNKPQRNWAQKFVSLFPNVVTMKVGEESQRQIVLRYYCESKNVGVEVMELGYNAYKAKDYHRCISLLETFVVSRASVDELIYIRLAECYQRVGDAERSHIYSLMAAEIKKADEIKRKGDKKKSIRNKTKNEQLRKSMVLMHAQS